MNHILKKNAQQDQRLKYKALNWFRFRNLMPFNATGIAGQNSSLGCNGGGITMSELQRVVENLAVTDGLTVVLNLRPGN